MNYLNTFIKAKNLDKRMVLDYLRGQDPRKVYPLCHAPLVPTFAGAIDIFELKHLEKVKVETQQSQGGLYVAIVHCMTEVGILVVLVLLKTGTKS